MRFNFLHLSTLAHAHLRDIQLQFYTFYFLPHFDNLEIEIKLSGQMALGRGQSIAYVVEF